MVIPGWSPRNHGGDENCQSQCRFCGSCITLCWGVGATPVLEALNFGLEQCGGDESDDDTAEGTRHRGYARFNFFLGLFSVC